MDWYRKLLAQVTAEELDGVQAPMDTPGKQWVYAIERAMSMATSQMGSFRLEKTYLGRYGEICKFRPSNNQIVTISVAFNPQTFQVNANVMMVGSGVLGEEQFTSNAQQIPQTAFQVSQFVSQTIDKHVADLKYQRRKMR